MAGIAEAQLNNLEVSLPKDQQNITRHFSSLVWLDLHRD